MSDGLPIIEGVKFFLDGKEVEARPGETIWQVASRHGTDIPHLCYSPAPGYRPDGNCRACMVEIDGERVLAASCVRCPTPGMKVSTASERADASRKLVFELLVADQPACALLLDRLLVRPGVSELYEQRRASDDDFQLGGREGEGIRLLC